MVMVPFVSEDGYFYGTADVSAVPRIGEYVIFELDNQNRTVFVVSSRPRISFHFEV